MNAGSRESSRGDIPSPIDLRSMHDARAWADSALLKRPWRKDFFARFETSISNAPLRVARILELGSGPGFLAERLLPAFPSVEYVALDFSPAMHQLAAERLQPWLPRIEFVERSFREPNWTQDLGNFDCVVTNQAVHELRHKRHAAVLHRQVREVLAPGALYLVCDHFSGEGGMMDDSLYMSVDEQREALEAAGFGSVELLLQQGGLVLHQAARSG
jgi:SAM-dependent methyltransferase